MILELSAVRKLLGGRRVLDGASLSWPGPGVLVIRGENGAGKSTLLRIVTGVVEKDRGTVAIAGHSIDHARARALACAGYVPDVGELPGHLVTRELFALLGALKRAPAPEPALIDRLGVRPLLGERLGALSLGQRRRVGLLSALLGDPPLLVLDEPTNGLDVDGLGELTALLRERAALGRSALIATHDHGFAEAVGATTLTLAGGRLIGGSRTAGATPVSHERG